ncbi:UbiA family prenyltransferase [Pseudomonas salmasensis]|uniref:UbiA family prenyltransferase n=1 Tax=Pseudomonas salmasensis TaxID=2745514 RepID=UPI0032194E90
MFNTAIELTKPGIIVGNLASVLGGYLLAASGHVASVTHGLATLLGTALVIGCGCVINNCIDRDIDRRMVRTCHRPLALRTIRVSTAAGYAIVLGTCGFGLLWAGSNALACGLAMVGLVIYAGGLHLLAQATLPLGHLDWQPLWGDAAGDRLLRGHRAV